MVYRGGKVMLKKELIKKIDELEQDKREIAKSFFKALKLINKEDMKMEISPAVREFCAYDVKVAKSKKLIKWRTYSGVKMSERLDKMGFPPEIFIKVLRILIRNVKRYEKEKMKGTVYI